MTDELDDIIDAGLVSDGAPFSEQLERLLKGVGLLCYALGVLLIFSMLSNVVQTGTFLFSFMQNSMGGMYGYFVTQIISSLFSGILSLITAIILFKLGAAASRADHLRPDSLNATALFKGMRNYFLLAAVSGLFTLISFVAYRVLSFSF